MCQVGRLVLHIKEIVEEVDFVALSRACYRVEDAAAFDTLVTADEYGFMPERGDATVYAFKQVVSPIDITVMRDNSYAVPFFRK